MERNESGYVWKNMSPPRFARLRGRYRYGGFLVRWIGILKFFSFCSDLVFFLELKTKLFLLEFDYFWRRKMKPEIPNHFFISHFSFSLIFLDIFPFGIFEARKLKKLEKRSQSRSLYTSSTNHLPATSGEAKWRANPIFPIFVRKK